MMTTQIIVTVRNGTTQHDNPHLLCSPPQWIDIASFLLGNFAAHAGTVVTYPGEPLLSSVVAIVCALTFPASGIARGLTAIVRHAAFVSDPLQQAAQAGALCMVVRNKDWLPKNDDTLRDIVFRGKMIRTEGKIRRFAGFWFKTRDKTEFDKNERVHDIRRLSFHIYRPPWTFSLSTFLFVDTLSGFVQDTKKVHGFYRLAKGYSLAHVPSNAIVASSLDSNQKLPKNCTISNNYSIAKAIVALVQLSIACFTIARNSSSEIHDNGYGSYSLTVVPYALMSFVNLLGLLLNPLYPSLFMVSSDVMEEATTRGSIFDGVVGHLVPDSCEVTGIEENQISGKFKTITKSETVTRKVIPDGWERRVDKESGNFFFVDHVRRRTTWSDPCTEVVKEQKEEEVISFIPDTSSKMTTLQWLVAMGQTVGHNPFQQAVELVETTKRLRADAAADKQAYELNFPIDSRGDEPSIFIPICPSFKRRGMPTYAVQYDRLILNRSWTSHFYIENGNMKARLSAIALQYSSLAIGAVSVAIIAGFTSFQARSSSVAARIIFMTWLGSGIFLGSGLHNVMRILARDSNSLVFFGLGLFIWMLPAGVGLYEVVVRMKQYGTCIRLN